MHSVQAGYTDKALSYADKALQIIQQQKGQHLGERCLLLLGNCLLVYTCG